MNTECLGDEERCIVEQLISESDFQNDEWIRFWDRDSLQLDGEFSLNDLVFFVKVMKRIKAPEELEESQTQQPTNAGCNR